MRAQESNLNSLFFLQTKASGLKKKASRSGAMNAKVTEGKSR